MSRRRSWRCAALVVALVVASCSDDGDLAAPTPTSTATPATTAPDDGILAIGAVLPSGGAAPDMGRSMRAALQVAVAEINAAGGLFGSEVRLDIRNEGDNPATATLAVQDLVRDGVDAIIGPTSSLNLLDTLSSTVQAGVLTCSPTASALSLDAYPDNNLLVRTVPSDSLQATAIARAVDDEGGADAVLVYLDDAYGRPFADLVETQVREMGTTIIGRYGFPGGAVPDQATIETVAALDPDVVVVVADRVTGPTIITAIDDASDFPKPTFIVNDSLRRPDASAAPYPAFLAERIFGVSPQAYSPSSSFAAALAEVDPEAGGLYASNAYDCLNLIALAAATTGSAKASVISAAMPAVSEGGSSCASFPSCMTVFESDRNPDYDGPDGMLTVDENGNTVAAVFEKFGFDPATGRDTFLSLISIGTV